MRGIRGWLWCYGRLPVVVRWTVVLASMGTLWWSSAQPHAPSPFGLNQGFVHNAAHVLAFAIVGASTQFAVWQEGSTSLRRSLTAWVIAASYGIVDELHQLQVPGRACSIADVFSDGFGAAIAVAGLRVLLCGSLPAKRCLPWLALGALTSVCAATWLSL